MASSFLDAYPTWALALFGVVGLLGFAIVSYTVVRGPRWMLLGIVLAAAVVQIYQPAGNISVALLLAAAAAPASLWVGRRFLSSVWVWVLLLLAVWQAVAALWSHSFGTPVFRVTSTLAILGSYVLARLVLSEAHGVSRALLVASPVLALQNVLVIVFRFFPGAESAYLTSSLAPWLTEPEVRMIHTEGIQENILEATRAGGLLLNGNIASLFGMATASIFVYVALSEKARWCWYMAALCALGAISTGSKTPIVLAVTLPLVVVIIGAMALRRWFYAGIALLPAVIGLGLVVASGGALLMQLDRSLADRLALWGVAADLFPDKWFLGVGYDGWSTVVVDRFAEIFGTDRIVLPLPPHNFVIQAWADAGLIAAALVLLAALLPIAYAARLLWAVARQRGRLGSREYFEAAMLFVAVTYVPLHGLTDTTSFAGDNHMIPFYGVAVALLRRTYRQRFLRGGAVRPAVSTGPGGGNW